MHLVKCLLSEFLGTAFLLATVVGSGALMHKLDGGTVAITVFGVAFATGCVLFALINTFGSVSAQFNPIVALVSAVQGNMKWSRVFPMIGAQVLGAIVGVIAANMMFELPAVAMSSDVRTGAGQWIGEFVATFGLIGTIIGCSRSKPDAVPASVAAYVAGAIVFTSSTCFANPAVTISRMFTTSITGIRAFDVLPFIEAQLVAATLAFVVFSWLFREEKPAVPEFFNAEEYLKTKRQEVSAK